MTGADRRRRRTLATRALLVAALGLGGAATGLWWSHARHDGVEADLQIVARIAHSDEGDLDVEEELAFDPDRLGEEELVRRIDGPARLLEVVAHDRDEVLELPRGDDGLTVAIGADAESPVVIRYLLSDDEPLDLGNVNADATVQLQDGDVVADAQRQANEALVPGGDDEDTSVPWNAIGLTVGVLAALAWVVSLRRSRREPAELAPGDELPSSHPPAVVGWLLRHGRVTVADLAATIVDLTARGFLLPYRREGELVLGRGRPADGLDPHETLVLDWLFAGEVAAREVDLVAQRTTITADPDRWADLWSTFVADVEARGRADDLVERDVASPAVLAVAAGGLALLVAGVVGTAHGAPGWLATTAAGALVLASATAFARRTEEGEVLAARWEAFGTTLRAGEGLTPHALAYAVTLGEDAVVPPSAGWPAQLVHDEVERDVVGWREAYLAATSVRGEPSERVRALLSLRALRRRNPEIAAEL